jgi:hypothetical protein
MAFVGRSATRHRCSALASASALARHCDVHKQGGRVDCGNYPGVRCQVKDATAIFNRMSDIGKLPASAWLLFGRDKGLRRVLDDVRGQESSPRIRAEILVQKFGSVHRIGRKLASMFVSALSTPALAPGLTPWFPEIDGNELVVIDTNVARAVDSLRPRGTASTYASRDRWVRSRAREVDLRQFNSTAPAYSPRLFQQALYTFCSKSNRTANGDPCASHPERCGVCVPTLCPFREETSRERQPPLSSLRG